MLISEALIKDLKEFTFDGYMLCVDIGATKTLARVIDSGLSVIAEKTFPTGSLCSENPVEFSENLKTEVEKAFSQSHELKAITVSTAGAVNEAGTVIRSPNLGWESVPLKTYMEKTFSLPVAVMNDCDAGVLAEKYLTPTSENIMYITLSSGVGGGLLLNNRLVRGENCAAAEVGHLIVAPQGEKCTCGRRGCLQAYCSGRSLAREFRKELADFSGESDKEYLQQAFDLIRKNDERMIAIADHAFMYLGMSIAYISGLLDISEFRLGGGVMNQEDVVLPLARKWAKEFEYGIGSREMKIERALSHPASPVLGASVNGKITLFMEESRR